MKEGGDEKCAIAYVYHFSPESKRCDAVNLKLQMEIVPQPFNSLKTVNNASSYFQASCGRGGIHGMKERNCCIFPKRQQKVDLTDG